MVKTELDLSQVSQMGVISETWKKEAPFSKEKCRVCFWADDQMVKTKAGSFAVWLSGRWITSFSIEQGRGVPRLLCNCFIIINIDDNHHYNHFCLWIEQGWSVFGPKICGIGVPQPPFTEKNLKNSIWNAPKQEVVQFFLSAEAEGGTLHIAKAQAVRLSIL